MLVLTSIESKFLFPSLIGVSLSLALLIFLNRKYRNRPNISSTNDVGTLCPVEFILKITVLKLRYVYYSNRREMMSIQATTSTEIIISDRTMSLLKDKRNYMKLCSISIVGLEKNALEAQSLLLQVFQNIEIYESSLSLLYANLLMNGKKGNCLRNLIRSCGALILIEKPFVNKLLSEHLVDPLNKKERNLYIVGLSNEIDHAKCEIDRTIKNNIMRATSFSTKPPLVIECEKSCVLNTESTPKEIIDFEVYFSKDEDILAHWNILKIPYEIINISEYTKDGFTTVWIPNAKSPELFWIQIYHNDKNLSSLERINANLSEHFNETSNYEEPAEISVGNLCCCPFQNHSIWLRSLILSSVSKSQSYILFVDYGDVSVINNEDCRILPELYKNLPWQAVPCSLRNIYRTFSEKDSKENITNLFLENISLGIHVPSKIKVVDKLENDTYVVDLIVSINNKDVDILDYIKALRSLKTSSLSLISDTDTANNDAPEKRPSTTSVIVKDISKKYSDSQISNIEITERQRCCYNSSSKNKTEQIARKYISSANKGGRWKKYS